MPRTTIVVPCYNEAKRLDVDAFRGFAAENRAQRFLFVNDGSRDATGAVLDDLRRADPDAFTVHDLPRNVGKAEAVRCGLLHALADDPEFVGYWDADLATPLGAIPVFTAVLEARPELEMVFGARVRLLGRSIERRPVRHLLGRIFATAVSCALRISIYDTQCGAKLFRATPEIVALFREPFATRWIFDVEILARLIANRRAQGLTTTPESIYELPLTQWRDVPGSKVKPRDFARATLEFATIYWKYLAPRRQPVLAAPPTEVQGIVKRPHFADESRRSFPDRTQADRP
ncbi:MAG: glycosyltransferase [Planctomycetaceae bacterium]|nr:glycosyltransferase [Planctomycetaceae bacterium]MBV8265436.1 glycosyltransferase [Planctomycetaceae bacterium]MBV8381750.1 glycosyltransferase [Planctomycetaceae bacterium]MBV8557054.1 glycosyltransferase [Planctomycetaceae bacterium]MBV8611408.1 glycosyltransferase [Singulisphaera sp.]